MTAVKARIPDEHGSLADEVNAFLAANVPRMHEMGIRVLELDEGRVVGTVPLNGNGNHLGSMYAGTLFGVAEMLGGAIARPTFDFARYYPTVKDLQIAFRRPARSDIRATATLPGTTLKRMLAEVERDGRTEYVVEAELTDIDGNPVATTRGIYQVRVRPTANS